VTDEKVVGSIVPASTTEEPRVPLREPVIGQFSQTQVADRTAASTPPAP